MGYFLKYSCGLPWCATMQRAGAVIKNTCIHGKSVICERDESPSEVTTSQDDGRRRPGIQLPVPSNSTVHLAQTVCPSGHWTHGFLACDAQSACWQQDSVRQWSKSKTKRNIPSSCKFPFSEMFTCTSGVVRVSYSLVCDHSKDCPDNSDEDFCVHSSCTGAWQFECSNKQVGSFVCLFLRWYLCLCVCFISP